jgi:hypothetical protein
MRFAKHLMFVGLRFAILCSLPHLFGGGSTAQTTEDVTVANDTKPSSNEIGARRGNSVAQNSSPLMNKGTIHVLFGLDTPDGGVFPTDIFTVADDTQKTDYASSFRCRIAVCVCQTAEISRSSMCLMVSTYSHA